MSAPSTAGDQPPYETGLTPAQARALGRAEGLRVGLVLAESGDYAAGWLAGWQARETEARLWRAGGAVGDGGPSHAELQRRRRRTDEPCQRRCNRCSACTRAAAARANLDRYGTPDYPGALALAGCRRAGAA